MSYSPFFALLLSIVFIVSCGETETPTENENNIPSKYENTPGELGEKKAVFTTEASQFFFHLSSDNLSSLNQSIHPDLGCYIIAPTPGMIPDYIHVKNYEALQKSAALQHNFLAPWNELLRLLREQKASYFTINSLEEESDSTIDICNFSKEGLFLKEEDNYTGLTEILMAIQEAGITEEIQENEKASISAFEKRVEKQIITGIKGVSEVYAEGFYFSKVEDKWYLSVIDLSDCAL